MELSEGNLYPSHSNEPLKNIIGTEAISVPIIL